MAMTVIIPYDVSDDGRRARLAALLQAHGDRVQYSVFVCRGEPDELDELMHRASNIIDPRTDSLYQVRQCSDCWEAIKVVGQASPPQRVLYWTVF